MVKVLEKCLNFGFGIHYEPRIKVRKKITKKTLKNMSLLRS